MVDIGVIIAGLFVATILYYILDELSKSFKKSENTERQESILDLWILTDSLQGLPDTKYRETLISKIVVASGRLEQSLKKKKSRNFGDIASILILAFVLLWFFYLGVNSSF